MVRRQKTSTTRMQGPVPALAEKPPLERPAFRRAKPSAKAPPRRRRRWAVSLVRKRAAKRVRLTDEQRRRRSEFVGTVVAPDRKAAKAAAIKQFRLSDEQRKRLMLTELPWSGRRRQTAP
jgi:hypothetical protein